MADRINRASEILNQILKNTPNNTKLANKIAEILYYIEVQYSEDYELIKNSILKELNEIDNSNIELKKVTVEAVLLAVQKQFEERKINALNNYRHTIQRLQFDTSDIPQKK